MTQSPKHHDPHDPDTQGPHDSRDPDDVIDQRDELRDERDRADGDSVARGNGVAQMDETVVDDAGPEPE